MISRREVMKWGAVAPVLLGGAHAAFAKAPRGLDALVLDRRFAPDSDGAALRAPRLYRIDGDVTALWYDVLDPVWRKPGFVLGGITGRDVLFVLEILAADRGRRVVSRKVMPARENQSEAPISWVIAPVHRSVRV
jgi:hypothetical protein